MARACWLVSPEENEADDDRSISMYVYGGPLLTGSRK